MLHVYLHANPFYGPNLKCYSVLSIVLYSASYRQIQIYRIINHMNNIKGQAKTVEATVPGQVHIEYMTMRAQGVIW